MSLELFTIITAAFLLGAGPVWLDMYKNCEKVQKLWESFLADFRQWWTILCVKFIRTINKLNNTSLDCTAVRRSFLCNSKLMPESAATANCITLVPHTVARWQHVSIAQPKQKDHLCWRTTYATKGQLPFKWHTNGFSYSCCCCCCLRLIVYVSCVVIVFKCHWLCHCHGLSFGRNICWPWGCLLGQSFRAICLGLHSTSVESVQLVWNN